MEKLTEMLDRQAGRCAICSKGWRDCTRAKRGRHDAFFLQYLYVDHDHQTGLARGLLCNACNTAIGLFGEHPARLLRAAAYLERHAAYAPSAASG